MLACAPERSVRREGSFAVGAVGHCRSVGVGVVGLALGRRGSGCARLDQALEPAAREALIQNLLHRQGIKQEADNLLFNCLCKMLKKISPSSTVGLV